VTAVGFQVYELTRDPLALGLLGLVEAIPALSLALFGGHVADRRDRRSIILATGALLVVGALALAAISTDVPRFGGLAAILGVVFLFGVAAGFERPALSAFEAQVIPVEHAVRGASWASGVWTAGAIAGPPLGGIAIALVGLPVTYGAIAVVLVASVSCVSRIARKPTPEPEPGEGVVSSLAGGVRFVLRSQPLLGSMALDLFAVLFGGAVALLPVFASDILHVGPVGLGVLRIAPSVGALLAFVVAARYPPVRHAGRTLIGCVAAFGVSMLVFGLSTSFALSLAALFVAGLVDGVSVVIRGAIVRLFSPEAMRGRIASVNWIFIGASNELGAFESGIAARVLGTVPSVVVGSLATLGVVALVVVLAPELRRLDLGGYLQADGRLPDAPPMAMERAITTDPLLGADPEARADPASS
jgi:MFS family permease